MPVEGLVGLFLQGIQWYRWLVDLLSMHGPDLLVEDLVHKQEQKGFIPHYLPDCCLHVDIADSGEEAMDKYLWGIIRFGDMQTMGGTMKRERAMQGMIM
jgi:hypothetical protein